MYLFDMTNGKKKLVYGSSPENALEILEFRSTEEEMALIIRDSYTRIQPREMMKHVDNLG
jgi:ribosomal protein S7